jgi:hypothetical protein
MLGILLPETQEPIVRGNLVATALGVSQVHLSWTASTDNVGVVGYLVERQGPGNEAPPMSFQGLLKRLAQVITNALK